MLIADYESNNHLDEYHNLASAQRVFFRKLAAPIRFYFEAPGKGFFSNSLFPCV